MYDLNKKLLTRFLADINGKEMGDLNIKPEELTIEAWDYIFLGAEYKPEIKIPEEKLKVKNHLHNLIIIILFCKIMRKEFLYWYPLDLRVSGKDLIKNHLTMALFNHAVTKRKRT